MPVAPLEVFISYAHADEALRTQLEKHLSLLQQRGLIAKWYDRLIPAGAQWSDEIDAHLNSAQLILLLISADFLASQYCYGIEMKRALERQEAGEARVIPIILRPVDWEQEPSLHKLQALPTTAKAVTTWPMPPTYDEAFKDIARGIRTVIEEYEEHPVVTTAGSHAVWNVPYRRNRYFTGQESVLATLETTLKANTTAALTQPQAINGLGGIGKTQIALEYAYRHEHAYRAILWVQADTHEALVSGFSSLASLLHLPEQDAQDQQLVVQAVKAWLETHTQWLLILDNADDLAVLDEFLPSRNTGHILLTTRTQAVGTLANSINVEPMESTEGTLLLLRRAKKLPPNATLEQANAAERATANKIVEELGGLPLALDQAAAYIEETGCGVRGYLDRYLTQRTALLQRRGTMVKEHPESVVTTWFLSFEKVKELHSTAADLLQFCAFLSPDAIPEELMTEEVSVLEPAKLISDLIALDEAVEHLRAYSLVQRNPETNALSMHRLVQTVIRDVMLEEDQRRWVERMVRILNQVFPSGEPETWLLCERYILHAQICVQLINQWKLAFPEATTLVYKASTYLRMRAQYSKAVILIQQILIIHEQVLGINHPVTARSLNMLAYLYHDQGKFAEAEPLYQRSLNISEQVFGTNHLETAASLNNLATLYDDQGKYTDAEPLYLRAFSIYHQELGPNHLQTIGITHNLANLYHNQRKYYEAETLYKFVLSIREQTGGLNHYDTASTLNNLAGVYKDQGKYAEAEPLYWRALNIYEQVFGPIHPHVAGVLNNLAALYTSLEKYAEAKPLLQRALNICEQVFGPDHHLTATTKRNYIVLLQKQRH